MDQIYLVGIDCSNCSQRAVDYAVALAKPNKAKIVVVHVVEWSPFSFSTAYENDQRHKRREAELVQAQTEIIDPQVSQLREAGVEAEGRIRHGHPAETLNQLANEVGATNIIVGRKGGSNIKAHLFGSVPSMLVQIADHPVTVVP
jgi:nucleotide-binding universal stress UspA family protein